MQRYEELQSKIVGKQTQIGDLHHCERSIFGHQQVVYTHVETLRDLHVENKPTPSIFYNTDLEYTGGCVKVAACF
jgi:hypothetical protein